MTSHASRDMTQHKQSHRIKWRDHYIKVHDMTWHATSQLTTVAHPTSPHNQPHYCISPRKQLHDIKTGHITTVEQQKARSQQRNGLGMALVGRLAHIL